MSLVPIKQYLCVTWISIKLKGCFPLPNKGYIDTGIGFTGDLGHFEMDWFFLVKVTSIAIAGLFIGTGIAKKIGGDQLKKGFGWFVLAMGLYILIKEIFL